ncbi:MAG: class I SAM-dependent RNA methyltransferase [Rubrivivax sp.]|nr:class I SAM-dependent RNA methyltransferase [Rubrivivax sp.]
MAATVPAPAALFVPCARGVEDLLATELTALTGTPARSGRGGAWVDGDLVTVMRINLESRLAQRVLWPLVDGPYRGEQDLYELARRVRWSDWITAAQTLRVDVAAQRSPLRSLNFVALRVKDAVCDALRDACGARPSVDTRNPTLPLALYLEPGHAWLYADTSGQALFKRGWRDEAQVRRGGGAGVKGEAPLKETLAAAMLAAAGWHGRAEDGALLDPCCGAGTIAIEAAQIACGIAPGLQRRFAFEQQLPFAPLRRTWQEMKQAAQARVHAPAVPIFAGDVSFRMTDFAARNARAAGVGDAIAFKTADALQRPPPLPAGTLMMNPPYGERIEPKGQASRPEGPARAMREGFADDAQAGTFFAALAAHWKRHYAGWSCWCLSPEPRLPGLMRLQESRRVPLWNGAIECRLFRFDIVAGSNRTAR